MNLNSRNTLDDSSSSYQQDYQSKYDPEVVNKLLGFIEMTFERKLGNLEKIDQRNTKRLKSVKNKLREAEKKVYEIQKELNNSV